MGLWGKYWKLFFEFFSRWSKIFMGIFLLLNFSIFFRRFYLLMRVAKREFHGIYCSTTKLTLVASSSSCNPKKIISAEIFCKRIEKIFWDKNCEFFQSFFLQKIFQDSFHVQLSSVSEVKTRVFPKSYEESQISRSKKLIQLLAQFFFYNNHIKNEKKYKINFFFVDETSNIPTSLLRNIF